MKAGAVVLAFLLLAESAVNLTSPPGAATATVDVAVLDADGAPIAGLRPADFEVTAGSERALVTGISIASPDVSIILIVDGTTSQPLKRYEINTALAANWAPALRSGDRARLGVLGAPLTLSPWLPADPRAAVAVTKPLIDNASPEPSPLWDATGAAIAALDGAPDARVIVILSDGRSNANRIGLDDVAEQAMAADVAISSVSEGGERVLAQGGDPAARVRPDASLQWLSEQTGGAYLADGVARRILRPQQDPFAYVRELIQTPSRPGPLLATLTSAMRQRYRVSFSTPADGRLHRLDVKVTAPGATAHFKRRYLAPR